MADGQAAPAAGNRPSNPTQATQPTGSPADRPTAGSPGEPDGRRRPRRNHRHRPAEGTRGRYGTESEAHASGRVARFREETRPERMRIADEAEARYGRKVAWGVEIGAVGDDTYERILFTHIAVPVMTRLRQPERQVLDTLVDAGVARSRSDALAWSVRLVGEHADEWLGKLRDAMKNVDDLRAEGPEL